MDNMDLLKKQICWVILVYNDGSKKRLRTTLNNDILDTLEVPKAPREDSLYDMNRKRFVSFKDVVGVDISLEGKEMDEINELAANYQ